MISDINVDKIFNASSIGEIQEIYDAMPAGNANELSVRILSNSDISDFKLLLSAISRCYGIDIKYADRSEKQDVILLITEDLKSSREFYATAFRDFDPKQIKCFFTKIENEVKLQLNDIREKDKEVMILVFSLPFFFYSPLGVQECSNECNSDDVIMEINGRLKKLAIDDNAYFFPYHRYATTVTRALWDKGFWDKLGRTQHTRYLSRLIDPTMALMHFIYPKCYQRIKGVVLDLDDTLWGGTLGEDGLENIKLDLDLPGYYFVRFQQDIKNLEEKGIYTAIASKNKKNDVLEAIEKLNELFCLNPSVIKAETTGDKAKMIDDICLELDGISNETIAFIDNSNLERAKVYKHNNDIKIPGFITIELHEEMLLKMPYIEKLKIGIADNNRTLWKKAMQEKTNFDIQLKLLEEKENTVHFDRVYELVHKTNQFNLTTLRLSYEDLKHKMDEHEVLVFAGEFPDNADLESEVFSVAVIKREDNAIRIENLLMSCRYLGFGMDKKILKNIVDYAKNQKKKYIVGEFIESEKNGIVKNWYKNFRFILIDDSEGKSIYRCLVSDLERILEKDDLFDLQEYLYSHAKLQIENDEIQRIREKDQSTEVKIPAQKIKCGIDLEEASMIEKAFGLYPKVDLNDEERVVKEFWIDKYCVSNKQYVVYLNNEYKTEDEKKVIIEEMLNEQPQCSLYFDPKEKRIEIKAGDENLPVVVGYRFACEYAEWVGGRLPTEDEWEAAAGGADNRWFPWGNELPDYRYVSTNALKPSPIDSYEKNISPYGVAQMVGNVWQWCDGRFNNHYAYRGGDYRFDAAYWKRIQLHPIESAEHCGNQVGFRVVTD